MVVVNKDILAELDKLGEPASALEQPKKLRAMFYGDTGAGKTTLAAQLIEKKACLIYADSAWVVVQKYPEIAKNIIPYPFDSFKQVRAIVEAHDEGIEPYASFDTLIWDTVSVSVKIMLRNLVLGKDGQKGLTFDKNQQIHPSVEGWPHYNIVEKALTETITALNRSDLNVIYTAHTREPTEQDQKKKKFAIRPDMPEACFKAVAREVQIIGWIHQENKDGPRLMQTIGTLTETAKCQIPTLEQGIHKIQEVKNAILKWKNPELHLVA